MRYQTRSRSTSRWVTAFALVAMLLCGAASSARDAPGVGGPQKDYSPFPNPDAGYVSDLADVLTHDEEEQIEQWLWRVEDKSKVEIIVVIIDSIKDYPGTPNQSIEEFATGLFNAYGIGNMPKNDGVLLLVAVRDRKARIELGAYYGYSRDEDAARIMNGTIVPRFRKGDYPGGITEGVKAIALKFAGMRIGINWTPILWAVAIAAAGLVMYSLYRDGKRGWGWVVAGSLILLFLALFYVLGKVIENLPKNSEGPSSSWSSGGIGGFGGGFSGGGGATGSW